VNIIGTGKEMSSKKKEELSNVNYIYGFKGSSYISNWLLFGKDENISFIIYQNAKVEIENVKMFFFSLTFKIE